MKLRRLRAHAVSLPCGGGAVAAALPPAAWWTPEEPHPGPGLTTAEVAEALRRAGLAEAAAGAKTVSVLVPDATRMARSDLYLPALFEVLAEAGVPREGVSVILATGSHPPPADDDPRRLLGPLLGRVSPVLHDPRGDLVSLGISRSGNELRISRRVAESDLVILTGRVDTHYFAGFTGGAKALLPGVAALPTIYANHRKVLDAAGRPAEGPVNGRIEGNPVREEMEEALALLPARAFLLNVVIDARGQIAGVHCGDPTGAHRAACQQVRARAAAEVPAPFDLVLASCGGRPVDRSLMQSLKTPMNWWRAVRPGGTFLWLADCGPARLAGFLRWLALPDEALRAGAVADYDLFAHNSILLRRAMAHCELVLISPLPPDTVAALGFRHAPDLATALDRYTPAPGARALLIRRGNATWGEPR